MKVLLDFDGTLAPSEELREAGIWAGLAYLKEHAKKHGIEIRDSYLDQARENVYKMYKVSGRRTCKRERFREVIKIAAENSGVDYRELIYELTKISGEAFRIYKETLEQTRLYDRAEKILKKAWEKGHPWWIFSNGTSEDVEIKLNAAGIPEIDGYQKAYSTDIEQSPSGLVTGISMNKGPSAYEWFMRNIGIEIMVGNDPEDDIKAAQEAGLKAILCQDGDYSSLERELL